MQRSAFVAVEVEHRCWIRGALALEIVGIGGRCGDQRHKRIHALDRIVEHQATFGDHVMTATLATAKQFYEIVSLAVDVWIAINPVIGNQYDSSLVREWALLNCGP